MAKTKPERYDEGLIKGKKVFFLGALPVLIFVAMAVGGAFLITNFTNKMSVNKDAGVCNTVRRDYPSSIQSDWPCDFTDKGDYYLVTFNQSANTGQVAALMSFKYDKVTKKVEPAISVN
jgi:hypothetical protein